MNKFWVVFIIILISACYLDNLNNQRHLEINGANQYEQAYIMDIINNTDINITHHISSVNVIPEKQITNICGRYAVGCAQGDYLDETLTHGDIYILPLSYFNNLTPTTTDYGAWVGTNYICGSFASTLNHEIGHIKGFMIRNESEDFANNYSFNHTIVNLLYEKEPYCDHDYR